MGTGPPGILGTWQVFITSAKCRACRGVEGTGPNSSQTLKSLSRDAGFFSFTYSGRTT